MAQSWVRQSGRTRFMTKRTGCTAACTQTAASPETQSKPVYIPFWGHVPHMHSRSASKRRTIGSPAYVHLVHRQDHTHTLWEDRYVTQTPVGHFVLTDTESLTAVLNTTHAFTGEQILGGERQKDTRSKVKHWHSESRCINISTSVPLR